MLEAVPAFPLTFVAELVDGLPIPVGSSPAFSLTLIGEFVLAFLFTLPVGSVLFVQPVFGTLLIFGVGLQEQHVFRLQAYFSHRLIELIFLVISSLHPNGVLPALEALCLLLTAPFEVDPPLLWLPC